MVTRGWNRYRNKSQHRKLTLEKTILPPLLQGFEPATFRSRVRRSITTELSPPPRKGWKEGGDQQQSEGTQRRRCLSSWSIPGQSKPESLIGRGSYSSMRQLCLFAGLGEEMGVKQVHKLSPSSLVCGEGKYAAARRVNGDRETRNKLIDPHKAAPAPIAAPPLPHRPADARACIRSQSVRVGHTPEHNPFPPDPPH